MSLLGSEASSDSTQNPTPHHGLQALRARAPACLSPASLCLSTSPTTGLRHRASKLICVSGPLHLPCPPRRTSPWLLWPTPSFLPQVATQMSWLEPALPDPPGKYHCPPCFISSGQFSLSEVIFFVHVYFLTPAWNMNSVGRGPAYFMSSVRGTGFLTVRL